jgi:uncharacterized protein (DUF924 family)
LEQAVARADTGITDYWYDELGSRAWFKVNTQVDAEIRKRFWQLHTDACRGGLNHWMDFSMGALALVIMLDQFSRRMYRGDPRAYANDGRAVALAKKAIKLGYDKHVGQQKQIFFYMPFQNSEVAEDQERSVELFKKHNDRDFVNFALWHQMTIKRFGRFPDRNLILERESTEEEIKYLAESGGLLE